MEVYKYWDRTAMISSEPSHPEPRAPPLSRAGELPLPPLNYSYDILDTAGLDISQLLFARTNALVKNNAAERLWHLEQTDDGAVARETVTISTNQDWTCALYVGATPPGWYFIFLSVSLKDLNIDLLKSMTIHSRQVISGHVAPDMGTAFKFTLEEDELRQISNANCTQLRLHRQIELRKGGKVFLSFSFGESNAGSFDLHSIKLASRQEGNEDHILYGDIKPQQILSLYHTGGLKRTLYIHSFAVSSSGDHAATVYFDDHRAFVDIWDLQTSKPDQTSSHHNPRIHRTPFARALIETPTLSNPDLMDICLSISGSGTQVALHSVEMSKGGIPFHVFRCSPRAPADHDLSRPWDLGQSLPYDSLHAYYGYGAFHFSASDILQKSDERYITCDGRSVSIYNIADERWALISNLTLSNEPNIDAARGLFFSMRGQYFAWTGTKGVVSIWDLENSRHVSYIPVDVHGADAYAQMSRDGSEIVISVKGLVTFYQTLSGIELGSYRHGQGDENQFEVILEQDRCMVLDHSVVVEPDSAQSYRRVVSTRDMSITQTIRLHDDYKVQYPIHPKDLVFAYSQGSAVNIIKRNNSAQWTLLQKPDVQHDDLQAVQVELLRLGSYFRFGTSFVSSGQSLINGNWTTVLTIVSSCQVHIDPLHIPLGPARIYYHGVFVTAASRLVLVTGRYLQVWKLSAASEPQVGKLELMWKLQEEEEDHAMDFCLRKIKSAKADKSGSRVLLDLSLPRWFRKLQELPSNVNRHAVETVSIPFSSADTVGTTEEFRLVQGIRGLVDMYADGDSGYRCAITKYLGTLVRPSSKCRVSCIVALCQFWTPEKKAHFEQIITDLLPTTHVTWIPENRADKKNDPLAIILGTAEIQPAATGVAKAIMEYCVNHANSSRNLSFLSPVFGSMREIMTLLPNEALDCLNRIAFIQAPRRSYIINNHLLVHPPGFRWRFWQPNTKTLSKTKDPVMQLCVTAAKSDPSNDKFTQPVYMASFDALWFYHEIPTASSTSQTNMMVNLYHMVRFKFNLNTRAVVECHEFSLEFFDNPAIAALVAYKWNTIGYAYWLVRFAFQSCYYSLILVVILLQVYHNDPSVIRPLFMAIIAMSSIFLWLEITQAVQGWPRYKRSGYNILDLFAFSIPPAASIQQLKIISQNDSLGKTWPLSFSVLVVFLHMLFELRINKNVCKYVTIIQQVVVEIRVFFVIFAAGIVAFTLALVHLIHACPVGECSVDSNTSFPSHFLYALSSTYFFMGGRYDPINSNLNTQNVALHVMMILFFFFTVILLLNVLIALINVAFTKGDDGWRLAWIESRLRYIEAAENMCNHIPGFRQSYSWFPREIYFSAPNQQVQARHKKSSNVNETVSGHWLRRASGTTNSTRMPTVQRADPPEGAPIKWPQPEMVYLDHIDYTDYTAQLDRNMAYLNALPR